MNVSINTPEMRQSWLAQLPSLRLSSQNMVLILLTLLVLVVSVAPLARLVVSALYDDGGFAFERLTKLFMRSQTSTAIINTLIIAITATIISLIIGTIFAMLVIQTDLRAKSAAVFAFVLPLMIPPQVIAMAWLQAFSPSSPIFNLLGVTIAPGGKHPLYSISGIVLVLGIYNAPLVYLALQGSLKRIPVNLTEAARAAGASRLHVLRTIILPLARGGVIAAACLSFVSAISNFGIQAMLGIPARVPTLITQIYQQINNIGPNALPNMAALSLILAALTMVAIMLASFHMNRTDSRVDMGGRGFTMSLGKYARPIGICVWLYLIVSMILPFSALLQTSLVPAYGLALTTETITFKNYTSALFSHTSLREAFLTSLWLTSTAVLFLTVSALFMGYFLTWKRGKLVRFLHIGAELTYTLPGVTLGVAMILLFLKPVPVLDISIYGTPWIILAAYIAGFFAVALRPVLSGYQQIDRSLEEAAQICGAGFLRRMKDIIWPIIAPVSIASAIIVFMAAINEIQTSILLISSGTRTIGPMIIFLEEGGASTLAAAVGCLMIFGILILMLLSVLFSRWLPKGVLPWQF